MSAPGTVNEYGISSKQGSESGGKGRCISTDPLTRGRRSDGIGRFWLQDSRRRVRSSKRRRVCSTCSRCEQVHQRGINPRRRRDAPRPPEQVLIRTQRATVYRVLLQRVAMRSVSERDLVHTPDGARQLSRGAAASLPASRPSCRPAPRHRRPLLDSRRARDPSLRPTRRCLQMAVVRNAPGQTSAPPNRTPTAVAPPTR